MDDDWMTNTGTPASAGDGAFERFLTAAIAAIITIMFSWRLLAQEEDRAIEAMGAVGGAPSVRGKPVPQVVMKKAIHMAKAAGYTEETDKLETTILRTTMGDDTAKVNSSLTCSGKSEPCDLVSEELITCWEEGQTNENLLCPEDSSAVKINETDETATGQSEYRTILDDQNYHSFDRVIPEFDDNIEPRELDSEEEIYCCMMLETIMEEDSDEMQSSSSETDTRERSDWNYIEIINPGESYDSPVDYDEGSSVDDDSMYANVSGESDEKQRLESDDVYDAQTTNLQFPEDEADDSNSEDSDESVITVVTRQSSDDNESPSHKLLDFHFSSADNTPQISNENDNLSRDNLPITTTSTTDAHVPLDVGVLIQMTPQHEHIPKEDDPKLGEINVNDSDSSSVQILDSQSINFELLNNNVISTDKTNIHANNVTDDTRQDVNKEQYETCDVNKNIDVMSSSTHKQMTSHDLATTGDSATYVERNEERITENRETLKRNIDSEDTANIDTSSPQFESESKQVKYNDAEKSSAMEKSPLGFILSRYESEITKYEEHFYITDKNTSYRETINVSTEKVFICDIGAYGPVRKENEDIDTNVGTSKEDTEIPVQVEQVKAGCDINKEDQHLENAEDIFNVDGESEEGDIITACNDTEDESTVDILNKSINEESSGGSEEEGWTFTETVEVVTVLKDADGNVFFPSISSHTSGIQDRPISGFQIKDEPITSYQIKDRPIPKKRTVFSETGSSSSDHTGTFVSKPVDEVEQFKPEEETDVFRPLIDSDDAERVLSGGSISADGDVILSGSHMSQKPGRSLFFEELNDPYKTKMSSFDDVFHTDSSPRIFRLSTGASVSLPSLLHDDYSQKCNRPLSESSPKQASFNVLEGPVIDLTEDPNFLKTIRKLRYSESTVPPSENKKQPEIADSAVEQPPEIPPSPQILQSPQISKTPHAQHPFGFSKTVVEDSTVIASSPIIISSPVIAKSSAIAKPPAFAKPSVVNSSPAIAKSPVIGSSPVIAKSPVIASSPVIAKSPVVAKSPVIAKSPAISDSPVMEKSPAIASSPVIAKSPVIASSPVIANSPVLLSSPVIASPQIPSSPVIPSSPMIAKSPVVSSPPTKTLSLDDNKTSFTKIPSPSSLPLSMSGQYQSNSKSYPNVFQESSSVENAPELFLSSPTISEYHRVMQSPANKSQIESSTRSYLSNDEAVEKHAPVIDESPVSSPPQSAQDKYSLSESFDTADLSTAPPRKPRTLKEIKRKLAQNKANRAAGRPNIGPFILPDVLISPARMKIIASRRRFLSEQNLASDGAQERFDGFKQSVVSPPRRLYKSPRRPSSSSYSSQGSLEHISELYPSFYYDDSIIKPHIDELHADCIFTPEGRRDILNKTQSIENLALNLNAHLRRYGSVTSLVETDLDTGDTSESKAFPETDLDFWFSLQDHQPLERAVSMTDLQTSRPARKHGKGRFADRHVPKSKSLQTLETNLDEDTDILKRTPSVHELRISKSLSKLNVPDWFKNSSLSKSGSCLLRQGSTSTMSSWGFNPSLTSSPCPSVTPQSNSVIIKTRVSPSSSMRLFKSTKFPAVPKITESKADSTKAPTVKLPSDKFRTAEKNKALCKIPIVPFAQIRAMFEAKAANARAEKDTVPCKDESVSKIKIQQKNVPIVTISASDIVQLDGSPKRPRSPDGVGSHKKPSSPTEKISFFESLRNKQPEPKPQESSSTSKQVAISRRIDAYRSQTAPSQTTKRVEPPTYSSMPKPMAVSKRKEIFQNPPTIQAPSSSFSSSNRFQPSTNGFSAPVTPDAPQVKAPTVISLEPTPTVKAPMQSPSIKPEKSSAFQPVGSSSAFQPVGSSSAFHPAGSRSIESAPMVKTPPTVIASPTVIVSPTVKAPPTMKESTTIKTPSAVQIEVSPQITSVSPAKEPLKSALMYSSRTSSLEVNGRPVPKPRTDIVKGPKPIDDESKRESQNLPNLRIDPGTAYRPRIDPGQERYIENQPQITKSDSNSQSKPFPVRVGNQSESLTAPKPSSTVAFPRPRAGVPVPSRSHKVTVMQSRRNRREWKQLFRNNEDRASVPSWTETAQCYSYPLFSTGDQSSAGAVRESSSDRHKVKVVWRDVVIADSNKDDNILEDATVGEVLEGLLGLNACARTNFSKTNNNTNNLIEDLDDRVAICRPCSAPVDAKTDLETTVTCQNKTCSRWCTLVQAKKTFKMCRNCRTYYCCRQCRKIDWENHKSMCQHSLANSVCKHVIKKVNKDPSIQYHMSRIARLGFFCHGRGCLLLAFVNVDAANTFLAASDVTRMTLPPAFVSLKELQDSIMFGDVLPCLVNVCETYNPENHYVLHVGVGVSSSPLSVSIPRRHDPIVQRCAKLRLSIAHRHPEKDVQESTTLILTAAYGRPLREGSDARRSREVCFINIQRKLRERGVNLRHQYSDVYDRLINFVADAKYFTPEIIYPVDSRTGEIFMCVIMAESEPEIEWLQSPDRLLELDLSDEC